MRINDEEEQPDDYAEDVVVAVAESRFKDCLRLRQSAPRTKELRYEKGQGGPKKMNPYGRMQEHLLLVRGTHNPDTRDSHSTSRSSSFLCTRSPFQRELITTVRIRA